MGDFEAKGVGEWAVQDVQDFLVSLELEHLCAAFKVNGTLQQDRTAS
jgi:hypothetical protein